MLVCNTHKLFHQSAQFLGLKVPQARRSSVLRATLDDVIATGHMIMSHDHLGLLAEMAAGDNPAASTVLLQWAIPGVMEDLREHPLIKGVMEAGGVGQVACDIYLARIRTVFASRRQHIASFTELYALPLTPEAMVDYYFGPDVFNAALALAQADFEAGRVRFCGSASGVDGEGLIHWKEGGATVFAAQS